MGAGVVDRADLGADTITLQGLRAFVAIGILSAHWGEHQYPRFVPQGQLLIDYFFLIEGYLAAEIAHRGIGRLAPLCAIRQRFLKVYPLYLLGLAFGAAVALPLALNDLGGWTLSLFAAAAALGAALQPTFSTAAEGAVYPFNPPVWAIVLELWTFSALMLLWPRLTLRRLLPIVALAAVLDAALSVLFRDPNLGWRSLGPGDNLVYWGGIARASFGFFAGAVLFFVVRDRIARGPRLSPLVIWALFAATLFLQIRFFALPLLFLAAPAIVWLAAISANPALLKPFGAQAGRHAYALYLLHYPVLAALRELGRTLDAPHAIDGPVGFVIVIAAVVVVAHLAARYFDEPLQQHFNEAANLRTADRSPVAISSETR